MNYLILSEVYYKNPEEYEKLVQSRLAGDCTVKLAFQIHKNPAFYCLCPEIFKLQEEIMRTDKKISEICKVLPNVALTHFTKRSLLEEIELTNNIEGVHSTRRELGEVLDNIYHNGPKKRFFGIVNKYNMLSTDTLALNSCEDIRQIYNDLVLDEILADDPQNAPDGYLFRKNLAEVTSPTGKTLHKGCFPEAKITADMNSALAILNDSSASILIRIAIFHYLFGYIHPFYDGNGRTSRFISSYLLAQSFEALIGYRLSYTIKKNIDKYYDAFKICNNEKSRGDITPFIIVFMTIIKESMENLLSALTKRYSDMSASMDKLALLPQFSEKTMLDFCFILVQAALFSENGISKTELLSAHDASYSTIDKKLKIVEDAGYLKKNRIGKPYYYTFNVEKL